jgi:hypothetical protein
MLNGCRYLILAFSKKNSDNPAKPEKEDVEVSPKVAIQTNGN